jgi:hypothetical protein
MKEHNVATLSRGVVERQVASLVDFLSRGEPTCPDQYTLHKASRYPTTTAGILPTPSFLTFLKHERGFADAAIFNREGSLKLSF